MEEKYKIITSTSSYELVEKVNEYIRNGWECIGSHKVQIKHSQNRFRGTQHVDTLNDLEYSQTIIKK